MLKRLKLLLPAFLFTAVLIGLSTPSFATFPGAAIAGTSSAGTGTTVQAVTTATVLSGSANLDVRITADFGGAITLPAASTLDGQTITITDTAGVGGGSSTGASENLIYILAAGSDTLTTTDISIARTRLLLWKKYGTVQLVSNGVDGWSGRYTNGWYVDPRAISGLEVWYDARRGISVSGSNVTAWGDISGNNVDLAQGTAADQPTYRTSEGPSYLVAVNDTSDYLRSTATPTFDSGKLSLMGAFFYDFSSAASTNIIFQSAPTASLGFFWSLNTNAAGVTAGFAYVAANNTALNSYVVSVRNWTTTMFDRRIQFTQLGNGGVFSRAYGTPTGGGGGASSGTAVSSFTQTIQVGNALTNCRIAQLMAFDSTVAIEDVYDLELAFTSVWSARRDR